MKSIGDRCLYLAISEEYTGGRSVVEVAKAALAGGVDMIQMREKDKPRGELIKLGRELAALASNNNAPFIVNDDPYIAAEAGADGVHLGRGDLERCDIKKARSILGDGAIVGVSAGSIREFNEAEEMGADYIGFGPVFPTPIKQGHVDEKDISNIAATAKAPVFFIGGIDLSNIWRLLRLGARRVALIRAICGADDVEAATRRIKQAMLTF
jgi:thiamine-phosphate pyrophosphorylase